ncbi:MAG: pyridoxal-phosphate dependent enzyme [Halobacteriaceae archaeon]
MGGLVCRSCGRTYAAGPDEPWRCACGHALDVDGRAPLPDAPPSSDRDRGLWAFADCLPVSERASLGEGWTPLVDAPELDAAVKLDYLCPSGSYKDRGATTLLSRAVELGVDRVLEDSSGNAGAAVAQYAARAGLDAEIYVPADAKPAKLRAIERSGATAVRVGGSRASVTDACVDAVEAGEGWYASHAWNPAFYAGTETFAYELAAQRGWSVPDAVVLPLGHGTLVLGACRGFRRMADAGWTDRVPRVLCAQAAGCAPFAAAFGHDADGDNDVADGVQIARPARRAQVEAAIRDADGDVRAVDADATEAALETLHRSGFYVEPTSAVAVAGLPAFRAAGTLDASADVVVGLTGHGLKA